jgi:hypothetical protein
MATTANVTMKSTKKTTITAMPLGNQAYREGGIA